MISDSEGPYLNSDSLDMFKPLRIWLVTLRTAPGALWRVESNKGLSFVRRRELLRRGGVRDGDSPSGTQEL